MVQIKKLRGPNQIFKIYSFRYTPMYNKMQKIKTIPYIFVIYLQKLHVVSLHNTQIFNDKGN